MKTKDGEARTYLLLSNLTLYKIIFFYIIIATTVRVRVAIGPYLTVFGSSAVVRIAEHDAMYLLFEQASRRRSWKLCSVTGDC